jgi:DNA ligase 1
MEHVKIKSIKKLEKSYNKYDLEVKDNHNFFANNILVHNCRAIIVIDETGAINFYSRQGKEFETLDNVRKALEPHGLRKIVLDGEICLLDEDGNENFQGIIKEIKRKDHTIQNPKFLAFDILHQDEFESGTSERTFSERQEELELFVDTYDTAGIIEHVAQIRVESDQDLQDYVDLASKSGWEGLMLRKDVGYQGKRSTDVLKVKKFHDAEYTVVAVESDLHRVVVDGQEVEEEMLSHVIIEHRGNQVRVGSGFNHEQKRYYFEHPEEIIGKEVTVSYFEETHNQNGGTSLRFPTFKGVYEGKRDF